MPAVSTQISQTGPFNRSIEMLRREVRLEDGGSCWKSEREERKEETSRESETVRLAIINHICCWRRPRILATRQTLRLPLHPLSIFFYQLGHSFCPCCTGPCFRNPARFVLFVLTLWKSDIMAADLRPVQREKLKHRLTHEHTHNGKIYKTVISQTYLQISSSINIKSNYNVTYFILL